MTTVDQTFTLIDSLIPDPLESETIPLDQSLHRILRQTIHASDDQPPFDRSSIDGYLVHQDQEATMVRILTSHFPGSMAPPTPSLGTAFRIYTGSSVPSVAALIMQEDTQTLPDGTIKLLKKPSTSLIRPRGSHFRKGATLVAAPDQLQPGSLGLLASLGVTRLQVSRLPRVAHLVTGAELVDPSQSPAEGQIRDANSIMIRSLLTASPSDLFWQTRIGDDRKDFLQSLQKALKQQPDMILLSGASSVGDQDHTGSVLQELGFQIVVRQVNLRPGKPLIIAQKGSTLAFGLPGNPLSHFVCFHLFVRRALNRWGGLPPAPLLEAELLSESDVKSDPRETWWPGHLTALHQNLTAHPLPWRDSSDLSCLAKTNALLRIPTGRKAGSPVEVLPTMAW